MKTRKLTTLEKRAQAMCQTIRAHGAYTVEVEWNRSSTWGMCPRIQYHGETAARASGCGYCKHSAVLAEALCWLGETEEERHAIARTSGAGVSSVRDALARVGWTLETVAGGKTYDVHTVRRTPTTH